MSICQQAFLKKFTFFSEIIFLAEFIFHVVFILTYEVKMLLRAPSGVVLLNFLIRNTYHSHQWVFRGVFLRGDFRTPLAHSSRGGAFSLLTFLQSSHNHLNFLPKSTAKNSPRQALLSPIFSSHSS